MEAPYCSSVSSLPTKISGIEKSASRPSTSVPTRLKRNGCPPTFGQKQPCDLPAMSSLSGGSSSGETTVVIRTAVNGSMRSIFSPCRAATGPS